jgi:putative flavoprotein involved in K+ transport
VRTTTVIIGAGHAGLAMSRHLTERSVDHVVLERGEVANAWQTERWPSLRLLTPNWQTRLPGQSYRGPDPDGFASAPEVTGFLQGYADAVGAPVRTHTTVTAVRATDPGYEVATTQGVWRCDSVVLASGACNRPVIPPIAAGIPASVAMVNPMTYRGPEALDSRGVLVVGASATGVQLADEIHRSGRPVTLAAGEHVRLPRQYRGRDVFWWMERCGVLDQRYDEVDDLVRARHVPSPQLIGTPQRVALDLNALRARGVRIVGRVAGMADGVAQFSGSLANICKLADLKLHRLLDTFDAWAAEAGLDGELGPPERFHPTAVESPPSLALDLRRGEIGTVVWGCGYRPDYSWLQLPVLDRRGRVIHDGGVVSAAPGVYLLGTPFLRRRRSSFISGANEDSRELADHLVGWLAGRPPAPPSPAGWKVVPDGVNPRHDNPKDSRGRSRRGRRRGICLGP